MAPEQDWCLECGSAVTTRIARPPGWRLPLLVGLAVLALLGVGVAIAVSAISDDADRAAAGPGTTSGSRTAAEPVHRTTSTAPHTTPTRTASVPGAREATGGSAVPLWPAHQQGYSIVVPAGGGRPAAERQARRLTAAGQRAGILKTDGYDFFTPGSWVVWVGRYPDRPAAQARLAKVQATGAGASAYVTLVRPRGGSGAASAGQ